ncbi:MAG: 5-formyltetrahydrofolate cyclo-ligase [Clostridia bacterium]|nr:5-formyltetrahydrofolate cyclo-ligase [Clostridia bacterium]
MDKSQARAEVKARLAALSALDKKSADKAVEVACADYLIVRGYNNVCIYNALPSEVATLGIVTRLLDAGCKVCMPIVRGDGMSLVYIDAATEYRCGAFGIAEPVGESVRAEDAALDAVVTPMLAYTDGLGRIGKGKGYYDRFFARISGAEKIGIAYSLQYVSNVELDMHDVPMDLIITEKGLNN